MSQLNPDKQLQYQQLQIKQYSNAITDLNGAQAALLLSTQGLSTAQIQQTLAAKGLTAEEQYQAMLEAGLLKSKQSLTAAELQSTVATLGKTEAESANIIAAISSTTATNAEGVAIATVTKKKIAEAVETGILTKEEGALMAAKLGVAGAAKKEAVSLGGSKILNGVANGAKAAAIEVKALAVGLKELVLSNPALAIGTTALAAGVGLVALTKWIDKAGERAKETAKKASDELNNTKSEIDQINSQLKTTNEKIDELNSKANLSLVESEELSKLQEVNNELERELRIKEQLEKQQKAEANEKAVEYFNTNASSKDGYTVVENGIGHTLPIIDDVEKKLERIPELEKRAKELNNQIRQIESSYSNYFDRSDYQEVKKQWQEVTQDLESFKSSVNSSISDFIEMDDDLTDNNILSRLDEIYNKYDEVFNGIAHAHEKKISGIFEKNAFTNVKERLIALGKDGQLSVSLLTNKFADLVDVCDKAGISAYELYQYIMALSNPNAIDMDDVRRQFMESLFGKRDITNKDDAMAWNKIVNAGLDTPEGYAAYLTVKTKFAGQTETWTPEDWISHVREVMESGEPVEIEVETTFSDILSDTSLKDKAEKLLDLAKSGELTSETLSSSEDYAEILKRMGGNAVEATSKIYEMVKASERLADMSSDMSSMDSAYAEFKEKGWVSIDNINSMSKVFGNLDWYDEFARIAGDSASTAEQIQIAFNDLATEYIYSTDVLDKLDETTKGMIKTQLEHIGIANAEEIVTEQLRAKKEALEFQERAINATKHDAIYASDSLTNLTINETQALLDEANMTDLAKTELADLVAQQTIFNTQDLDVDSKIEKLNALAMAYFGVESAMNGGMGTDSRYYNGATAEERLAEKWKILVDSQKKAVVTAPKYTGGPKTQSASKTAKEEKEKTEKVFSKLFDWIEIRLAKLQKETDRLINKAEKFFSWWQKNSVINKAIKNIDKQIKANEQAYNYYEKKANKVKLSEKYKQKVRNGDISVQDIKNESLANKIDEYQQWYNKMQDCLDSLDSLYDKERDLIKQKLESIIDYFDTIQSYYDSIASKLDAQVSLKNASGQKTSVADLLSQYANATDTVNNAQEKADAYQYGINTQGRSSDEIRADIEEQKKAVRETATYQAIWKKKEGLEEKKRQKGLSKAKEAELQKYYQMLNDMENNASADSIIEYKKAWEAKYKFEQSIAKKQANAEKKGKTYTLTANEIKKQNLLEENLQKTMKDRATLDNELADALATSLAGEGNGDDLKTNAEKAKEAIQETYDRQMAEVDNVAETQTYKYLQAKYQAELAKKDAGKKYNSKNLAKWNAELEALKEGATAANISDYIKTWESWYNLEQKRQAGKKYDTKKYDTYRAQLDTWDKEKQNAISDLTAQMQDELDKLKLETDKQVTDNETEILKAQERVFEIAKQIVDMQATSLEQQIEMIEAQESALKDYLSLLNSMDKRQLVELGYVDSDDKMSDVLTENYRNGLESLSQKRDLQKQTRQVYQNLIDASLGDGDGFATALADEIKRLTNLYGAESDEVKRLQEVIKLLNENDYSDNTWVEEWQKKVMELDSGIIDTTVAIKEMKQELAENVTFKAVKDVLAYLGAARDTLDDFAGIIDDKLLRDADGTLSQFGKAKVGLLVEGMEKAQAEMQNYAKYIGLLNQEYEAGTYSEDEYIERLRDLQNSYRESEASAKSYVDAIVELMKKQKETEIQYLNDLIKKRIEALKARREYDNYGKNIKSKTKDIESLKAQIAALDGVTDAANRAKKAQLEAQLAEAEEDLQDTKDEHLFNEQVSALEKLSQQLTDSLDDTAKDALEILKEQGIIIEQATQFSKDNFALIQDSIGILSAFYSGMGMKIDGTEIPKTSKTSAQSSDMSIDTPSLRIETSMVDAKAQESMEHVEYTAERIKEMLEQGILTKVENFPVPPIAVWDSGTNFALQQQTATFENMMRNMENSMRSVAERNKDININLNYDSMLKVNGNVDKSVVADLQKLTKDICEYTKSDIYKELRSVGVTNYVKRF